jgi:hypothetical protein
MMKKTFILVLGLIILAAFFSMAVAEEKNVQITVPGCSA